MFGYREESHMFYNKNNPQWQFSEEQYLSRDEYNRMIGEYDEFCRSMLSVDVRDLDSVSYGIKNTGTPEEQEAKRKKSLIGIIIAMAVFAALVLLLIFKQIVIFGFAMCAVFLIAGIMLMVTGKGEAVESTSKAYLNRIIGAGITLASVSVMLLLIFRERMPEGEFFILLFVAVFGIAGLGLLVLSILKASSGKFIYTQEVTAECKGYVRCVKREEGSNSRRRFSFICTSPLFSYSYEGVQYEAVWDEFNTKEDSDIAMGQSVQIKVDPRHPENIMAPSMTHPGSVAFQIIMGILCLGVAAGLGIYVSTGAAKNVTVETEWNPVIEKINGAEEDTRTRITDDMIREYYLEKLNITQEWYYEVGVVATVEDTADGQLITYTDEAINAVLYTDRSAPEPGTSQLLYYTIDEDCLSYGKSYKRTFASGDSEKFVYVGSHTAYSAG